MNDRPAANAETAMSKLLKELETLRAENEHLRRQVKMAVNLRYHLMPGAFPVFNDLPEVDVYGDQIGMAGVGGDFFDIFRIDADHIGLLVSDVFDGGDAAALFMVTLKLYLMGELGMGFSPEKLIEAVNNRLSRSNEDNLSLSAWFGVYEVSTGRLQAVNAGHEPPLIIRQGKAAPCNEDVTSYLLGVMEGMTYESYSLSLEPGDGILVCTDGLWKAEAPSGSFYDTGRLAELVTADSSLDAEALVGAIQSDLISFIGDKHLGDDVTLLCLKRRNSSYEL